MTVLAAGPGEPEARRPPSPPRLRALDALRGLAALAVVLFHYTYGYEDQIGPHTAALPSFTVGHLGVELFFIVSGFVIARTLERTGTVAQFALQRVARLYPAFLACSVLTLGVIAFGGVNPLGVGPSDAVAGLTMLSRLLGRPPIDPSTWTLTYEIAFYALIGAAYFGLRLRDLETVCALWLGGCLAGILLFLPRDHPTLTILLNIAFVHLFVVGAMLARAADRRLSPRGAATLTAALAMLLLGPRDNPAALASGLYALIVLGFAGAVWLAATGRLRPLEWGPLVALGEVSYGLYLIHQILGYWIIARLEAAGWHAALAVAAALAASLLVAVLVRRWVEVPAQRALRRLFERGRSRAVPVPQSISSTASAPP